MESFERELARATAPETREILGAIGLVVDGEGNTLYHHASGYQSLAPDAPPIDPNSTFALASAGKFITHVAALICVERGMIGLDDGVGRWVPELSDLSVLEKKRDGDGDDEESASSQIPVFFSLRPSRTEITLRHLLNHSSGIGSESEGLVREWRIWKGEGEREDFHPMKEEWKDGNKGEEKRRYDMPLLFEPGEGWNYGPGIEWLSLLLTRLTQQPLPTFIQTNIFNPLNMTSTTYYSQSHPEINTRLLQTIIRSPLEGLDDKENNNSSSSSSYSLKPLNHQTRDLVSSVQDLGRLLSDLIASSSSSSSKILKRKESLDLLFLPQFSEGSPSLTQLEADGETYAKPAGIPISTSISTSTPKVKVNHTTIGLLIQEEEEEEKLGFLKSGFPCGSVTWNGMLNLIWIVNRDFVGGEKEKKKEEEEKEKKEKKEEKKRGIAAVFATQVLPVDDERTVGLAMEFFRGVFEGGV